jgi:hypothetical protein
VIRRNRTCRAAAALAWAGGFALAVLAASPLADGARSEFFDPEYAERLRLFRVRRAERPADAVLAVLGSSRLGLGFAPERLPALSAADGRAVLPFNFSHLASGPVFNRLLLKRMLADGVRPDAVLVELMPEFLAEEPVRHVARFLGTAELHEAVSYLPPWEVADWWLKARSRGGLKSLAALARECLPGARPGEGPASPLPILPLGGCSQLDRTPAEATARYGPVKVNAERRASYGVSPAAERALRELLADCRRAGIRARLIVTPESTRHRAWYPTGTDEALSGLVSRLRADFGVGTVWAREWLADDEFYDTHHTIERGAWHFTDRLHREVLGPWLASADSAPCGDAQTAAATLR